MVSKMALKPSKTSEQPALEKKSKGKKKYLISGRGIIYISHLPHGFYEQQLRKYLEQFGVITNLRVGRSKKTGGSKGYAFVEFKYPEVAKIVCETMNNYLMFDRLVKCEMVQKERANSKKIFKEKINPNLPPGKKARQKAKKEMNQLRTEEQNNRRLKRQLSKLQALKAHFEEAGIESMIDIKAKPRNLTTSTAKSPVMQVDLDDSDIKLKTPPNIRKVKSASNSAANSAFNSNQGTPSKASKKKKRRELSIAAAVVEKLAENERSQKTKKNVQDSGAKGSVKTTPKSEKKMKKRVSMDTSISKKSVKGKSPQKLKK